jgi:hypothetical protein
MVKSFSDGVSFSHSFLAFQGSLGKRGNIPSGETAKEGEGRVKGPHSRGAIAPGLERNFVRLSREGACDPQERAQGRPGARCTRGLMCNVHQRKRT